ncbi:type II secretion system secretin GspD [Candidatus Halobeggiatoa sp. HSG11]|nr:type II secretion system secretin GspD [Candidatus Halobeggiatoa sp. HSG11]
MYISPSFSKFQKFTVNILLLTCLLLPNIVNATDVTLNFRDMDIKAFIDIISKETGKTFVVDPRVKGKITVISSEPMDEQQIYDVFLSILSVHGFTAVSSGSVIKIIPENLAKSQDSPVLPVDKTPVDGSSFVTQIVTIKHVSAAQLIPLLRPLIRQQGHLVAYPNNNNLVIYDNANNVKRLLKIIHRIDQPADENIEVIVLEHATAAEIVSIISKLERKNDKTQTTNIIADDRTNTVLISGSKATRLRLRTIVTHLDTPVQNTGNTQVIYLRYAQAKDLVAILKGINSTTEENVKDKPPTERTDTNIQADENTNSLIITATPKALQNIKAVIRQLDIRRAQVLVEAVIAEVSSDMVRELGVQWWLNGDKGTRPIGAANFDNAGSKIADLASASYQGSRNIPMVGIGSSLGIGTFTDKGLLTFGLLLQALDSDTDTNVLSTPSLLTLDNQEAEIVVGQNVPFVTGQYNNTGTTNNVGNPFQTIQREDVGIKLKVKPQINEGNAVKLDIEQEVSSISPSSSASDIVTNKRNIKTTVIVEDGNMIVLGGLIDEELQQTTKKVPGLGDLPIIGSLFRSESAKKIKRNLMVFLRPVIVRDADSENIISGNKYSYMRIKQLEQKLKQSNLDDMEKVPVLPDLNEFLTILPGEVNPLKIEPQLYR